MIKILKLTVKYDQRKYSQQPSGKLLSKTKNLGFDDYFLLPQKVFSRNQTNRKFASQE